jgi:hypothetical protein
VAEEVIIEKRELSHERTVELLHTGVARDKALNQQQAFPRMVRHTAFKTTLVRHTAFGKQENAQQGKYQTLL